MRPFIFEAATDSAGALAAARGATASYLAGGTTLLDLMKLDVMRPETVIDINALARDHGAIVAEAGGLRLGAAVRMAEAAEHPEVCFVDTHPHLDGDHEKFIDLIHFTGAGDRQLAENIFTAIRGVLEHDVGTNSPGF